MVSLSLDKPHEPDPDSVAIMAHIDRMKPWMRALVREYGYAIIRDLLAEADNAYDPFQLADQLQTWRERRQEQWLATNYITTRSAQSIADAVAYRLESGEGPRNSRRARISNARAVRAKYAGQVSQQL